MNYLSDLITYIRRIIKSPSDAVISDSLIVDYINRFWLMDVDARMQLFDLKTVYRFQTVPNVDQYNMPLFNVQSSALQTNIGMFPVYQGFEPPVQIQGIDVNFYTQRSQFLSIWPNYVQPSAQVATGDGTANYSFTLPFAVNQPSNVNLMASGLLRGHVDISGIVATGSNIDPIVGTTINTAVPYTSIYPSVWVTSIDANGNSLVMQDSGQFLSSNVNCGLFMTQGTSPFGYSAASGGYSATLNSINYSTGAVNVTFTDPASGIPVNIPSGQVINAQSYWYNPGLPRSVLFYNNVITLRNPPDRQYLVELTAYKTPCAYLATGNTVDFAYMTEYLARGAARKIMADTGDREQFAFYEPLFREQEMLVWKRSQRQFTSTRTQTIYGSGLGAQGSFGNNNSLGLT